MKFKVIYFLKPSDEDDEDDVVRYGELPFAPFRKLLLDCGDGEFRFVEDVFYHVQDEEFSVYFENASETRKRLREMGWVKQPWCSKS